MIPLSVINPARTGPCRCQPGGIEKQKRRQAAPIGALPGCEAVAERGGGERRQPTQHNGRRHGGGRSRRRRQAWRRRPQGGDRCGAGRPGDAGARHNVGALCDADRLHRGLHTAGRSARIHLRACMHALGGPVPIARGTNQSIDLGLFMHTVTSWLGWGGRCWPPPSSGPARAARTDSCSSAGYSVRTMDHPSAHPPTHLLEIQRRVEGGGRTRCRLRCWFFNHSNSSLSSLSPWCLCAVLSVRRAPMRGRCRSIDRPTDRAWASFLISTHTFTHPRQAMSPPTSSNSAPSGT